MCEITNNLMTVFYVTGKAQMACNLMPPDEDTNYAKSFDNLERLL